MFEDPYTKQPWSAKKKATVAGIAAGAIVLLALGFFVGEQVVNRPNQEAARETLATLNQALSTYYERFEGYPDTLERLGGKEQGELEGAPPEKHRLLDTTLALDEFEQAGYRFRYQPMQRVDRWAAAVPLFDAFQVTAGPLDPASEAPSLVLDWPGEIRNQEEEGEEKAATPEKETPEESEER